MPETSSLAELVASRSEPQRVAAIGSLTEKEAAGLLYDWQFWARPNQLPPPGEWYVWLILAGRGWGKTRTGSEYIRSRVEANECGNIALIAETAADARDVMVEGAGGILPNAPPWDYPNYEPSKRRLTWTNGAQAHTYSGDEPDQLRGPQHDLAWADEPAKWKYPQEAWDNLEFGLRAGSDPRIVATTTPRPIPLIRALVADSKTVVTRGATWENIGNLAPQAIERLREKYEGTRLGRQELYAEILDDVEGALWQRQLIERGRVREAAELIRVVVAIDPAVTSGEDSDETGIIVAGVGRDRHGYVLADLTCRESPDTWARRAVAAYYDHRADRIVAEVNNGGDLVEAVLRTVDPSVAYSKVHASRGKITRAEPIAALYEQGRIHHVGMFAALEDEMCSYVPGSSKSPDRMDALVWAFTELLFEPNKTPGRIVVGGERELLKRYKPR